MAESRISGQQRRSCAYKVHESVSAMVVPASGLVKAQAEAEGLDKIFKEAGFEWREAGCSMCLGMNPDQLKPEERCASTSRCNFEGAAEAITAGHASGVAGHGSSRGSCRQIRRC